MIFLVCAAAIAVIAAGWASAAGPRRIAGTGKADVLHGGTGNDRLWGGRGNDRLAGGRGADTISGGRGNDRIWGGRGRDRISGGRGNDRFSGGRGKDRLSGGRGNDRISARDGTGETIDCGPGRDVAIVDDRDRLKRCETVRSTSDSGDRGESSVGDADPATGGSEQSATGEADAPQDAGAFPPSSATQPNIVFILTDDQRYDTVTLELMPNVWSDLVEQGLTFANAFTTRSLCCPARASILTGQYAHNHGVLANGDTDLDGDGEPDGGFQAFDDSATLATWLQAAGYRTGLVGKYLNGYGAATGTDENGDQIDDGEQYVPPGWDTFRAFTSLEGNGNYYDYALNIDGRESRSYPSYTENGSGVRAFHPENYSTTVLAEHALDFIDASTKDSDPFFLYLALNAPHLPWIPAEEDKDAFADLPAHRPPSFNEDDVSDKPQWVQNKEKGGKLWKWVVDVVRLQQLRTGLAVDRTVGSIVDRLEELGVLGNTVIVFTSDNGYLWGEHRLIEKLPAYEESIRVPLVVRGPGVRHGETDLVAANIDLAPTFAELAGAWPTLDTDGRALASLFAGEPAEWRTDLLVEHWDELASAQWPPTFKALRTEDYKYVEYDTGERELYDLGDDRYEEENLAGDEAWEGLVNEFSERTAELARCAGNDCRR